MSTSKDSSVCVGRGFPVERIRGMMLGMAAGKAVAVERYSQGQFVA